jgi:putative SOS response-associated peptidase YedK
MCGRAYQTFTEDELAARYDTDRLKREPLRTVKTNYNLAPTHLSPIILIRDGTRCLDFFRWGLVPAWATDIRSADRYSLINARAEEVNEKRSYQAAFVKRRCLVPVSGFYEWHRPNKGPKVPYAIHLADDSIMSLAGIWEYWQNTKAKQEVYSFSILTVAANALMEPIHNRMPVILNKNDEQTWLDPNNYDTKALLEFAKPCDSNILRAYQISTLVNSPKNNNQELLNPVPT